MADGSGGTASNGTAGRLCTLHKNPNTAPTPGANYGTHTPDELAKDLDNQAAYACQNWKAGGGVVGPSGQENDTGFAGYNDPSHPNYEQYQAFGYQHDLQATDADLQHGTDAKSQSNYTWANRSSAVQGMW